MAGRYPQEFREDVVEVARRREPGVTLAQVAKDFGVSDATLSNWLRQADVDEGRKPGVTKDEAAEIRELRRRNRLLEQENEVLRRAAAYLSQANVKLGGSPKSSTRSSASWPKAVCPSRLRAGCSRSLASPTTAGRPARSLRRPGWRRTEPTP